MLGLAERNLLAIVLHTKGAPLEIHSGTGVTTSRFSWVVILFGIGIPALPIKTSYLQDFNLLGVVNIIFQLPRKSRSQTLVVVSLGQLKFLPWKCLALSGLHSSLQRLT